MTISPNDHALETFRSLITISQEALKNLVLLNGGSVVALLAYLGQIEGREKLAAAAGMPIGLFIAGLICVAAAFIFSYLTQLSLYNEAVHDKPRRHPIVLWLSIGLSFASLLCFSFGAFAAIKAFTGIS